jgi:hypothetical protein
MHLNRVSSQFAAKAGWSTRFWLLAEQDKLNPCGAHLTPALVKPPKASVTGQALRFDQLRPVDAAVDVGIVRVALGLVGG